MRKTSKIIAQTEIYRETQGKEQLRRVPIEV